MHRRIPLKRIAAAAKGAGVGWELKREGANHSIWQCGSLAIAIPRHAEIAEGTATAIFKELESELGRRWWK